VDRQQRHIWAEAATGVCIVLVVLWQVLKSHYLEITWRISPLIPDCDLQLYLSPAGRVSCGHGRCCQR
jgi:uncharacterized membrane protein YcfT